MSWVNLAEFLKDFSLGTEEGREKLKKEWPGLYDLLISEEPSEEEIEEIGKTIDVIVEMGFPYYITKEELENSGI